MRIPRITILLSPLVAAALIATGCSSQDSTESQDAPTREASATEISDGPMVGGKPSKLPEKIPTNPFEAFNTFMGGYEFLEGILACSQPQGCFGDAGKYELNKKLDEISSQLDELKSDVAEGFAITRLEISEANYANAERDFDARYGSHIPAAMKQLDKMSNLNNSAAVRKTALRDFKREAQFLMPASAESAMRDYLTTLAGNGRSLTQGGFLGAAWKLISAGARQSQGDGKGETPLFLPTSSVNLMSDIGTQHLVEGAQLAGILAAYTVLLDPQEFKDDLDSQDILRRDLESIWTNGVNGVPGSAAITAALPRKMPEQSGVFTSGFGSDKSNGLLVRNFGRTVDPVNRTGPLVNADSAYALTPGFDEWLHDTKRAGDPRRELAISRTGVDWAYYPSNGALATTVTRSSNVPIFPVSDNNYYSEFGSLIATHPQVNAGGVAQFAKADNADQGNAGWDLDLERGRINPAGRSDLCLGYSTRYEGRQYSGISGVGGQWTSGYDAIGPKFAPPYMATKRSDPGGTWRLPRVALKNCANDSTQKWFLQGPIPQDGLSFWNPSELMPLSAGNLAATENDGYPVDMWHVLSLADAQNMRESILGRGVKAARLFELYGSADTAGIDRSLPPLVHPLMWTWEDRVNGDKGAWPPGGDGRMEAYSGDGTEYKWTAAVLPILDGSKQSFYFIGSDGVTKGSSFAKWVSTSAVLGLDVEGCTFLFQLPQNSSFSCNYKQGVNDQLSVPPAQITSSSPLRITAESAGTTSSASATPTESASATPSPSSSTDEDAPNPTDDPDNTPTPSPSSSEAVDESRNEE